MPRRSLISVETRHQSAHRFRTRDPVEASFYGESLGMRLEDQHKLGVEG